jgi:hypothetical protein
MLVGVQLKSLSSPRQSPQSPVQTPGTGPQLNRVPDPLQVSQFPTQSAFDAAQLRLVPLPLHTSQLPVHAAGLAAAAEVRAATAAHVGVPGARARDRLTDVVRARSRCRSSPCTGSAPPCS